MAQPADSASTTGRQLEGGTPALELDSVSVSFGGLTAVDDVSLTVRRGERCAIIGPNGAGKTTLFRAISGEVGATRGRVAIGGVDATRMPPEKRAALGLGRTYQVTSVFGPMSVEENVLIALLGKSGLHYRFWWPLRMSGTLSEQVDAVLDEVLLGARRHDTAIELSHGEQRQLELGLALASAPTLLLLDEPAAGLSGSERIQLEALIAGLDDDLTLLLIEHDVDLAFKIADRVICMDRGAIVEEGTPEEVRASELVQAIYLGAG